MKLAPLMLVLGLALIQLPAVRMNAATSRGDILKGYRTHFGLTQATLARLSGLSATKISRIERGLDSITDAQALILAKPLDSIFRVRYAVGTEGWLMNIIQQERRVR